MNHLPETGYVRLHQIIGNSKKNIPALIPVSRSTWWRGVKDGRYPRAVRLGPRITAWPVQSVKDLIASTAEVA